MKFMCLGYMAESTWEAMSKSEQDALVEECLTYDEVLKASGLPQMQENVMTISASVEGGQLDPKAAKLWKLLQANGFRQVGVVLHARPTIQP